MVERLIGIVGIVLTVLAWVLPGITTPWRVAITGVVCAVAAGSVATWLRIEMSGDTHRENLPGGSTHVGLLPDMRQAFEELGHLPVRRLRVLCYVGNYVRRELLRWPKSRLIGLDVRIIVRNPNLVWMYPPSGSRQETTRKKDARELIRHLTYYHKFKELAQRQGDNPNPSFVRFFKEEPTCRVVVADMDGGDRRMYIGFYPLQSGEDIEDFSGTDRPVLEIREVAGTSQEVSLIGDFSEWFEFLWKLKNQSVRDPRPIVAVDYDGVIADTNSLKSQWIARELKEEVPPHLCSHSECARIIGEQSYSRLADYAYGEEASAAAQQVPGVHQALSELSKHYRFVVVSARPPDRLEYVLKWLEKHRLRKFFLDVLTSHHRAKLPIVMEHEGVVIIDDDWRHLQGAKEIGVLPILFSASGGNTGSIRVSAWNELVPLLLWASRMQERHLSRF